MQTERGRAVLSCADPSRSAAMGEALAAAGYGPVVGAADVSEVLQRVQEAPTALILTDAILPGGDGVSLARAVVRMPLILYPYVLLTRPAGFWLPDGTALEDLGATALALPVTAAALTQEIEALAATPDRLPPMKAAALDRLLDRLGIPDHPGREMLARAVAICWRDDRRRRNLRDRVYPDAARPLGRTAAQAERAIRHVIEAAWGAGEIDEQQRIFGDTIDARRGRPTCGEMIARLADILRWEG